MFRLVRSLIFIAILGGVGVLSFTVPLGDKTLWGHLRAISVTKESQELVDGVKKRANDVFSKETVKENTEDQLTDKERELLRKMIRNKLKQSGDSEST